MSVITYLGAVLVLAGAGLTLSDNSTESSSSAGAAADTCGLQPEGPWSAALEDWVTAERVVHGRHGRIMALPSSQGYYVTDRIDLTPPPPPHHHSYGPQHMNHRGPYPVHHSSGPNQGPPADRTQEYHNSRLQLQQGPSRGPAPSSLPPSGPPPQNSGQMPYDEWQATPPPPPGAGKIVNKPPNPYKDQFKPSYPPPSPPHQPIPVHSGLSDRVDEARPPPPQKQVSETDLYLLGAIEKLVYRVDLMEKRLRKMEENVHYLVAGTEAKPEPCQANYTRVGSGCYSFSSEALNWKNANYACRKLKGHLLELEANETRPFTSGLLADKNLKGFDFWTGGLNPGLLWIWSHSAKAVGNATDPSSTTIAGEGRCLALAHDPALRAYRYRGQDCALRHRFVCERDADTTTLGNEIERVARHLRETKRLPKMKWTDERSL